MRRDKKLDIRCAANGLFDKEQDAASYDDIAPSYNKFIERLSAPLAARAASLARLEKGNQVLDVGTGTGILARCAARSVGLSGTVTGVDLSSGMLRAAVEVTRQQEFSNAEFRRMDAEALDFPDQSFDAVISLCAVSHFPNISNALAEMYRVLRRGGRLVVGLGCGRPPAGSGLLRYSLRWLRARAARRPKLWAPHFLIDVVNKRAPELPDEGGTSWAAHGPAKKLVAFVETAGFQQIRTCWVGHTVVMDSAEEFWEAQASIVTSARKRLLSLLPEQREALRKEFVAKARQTLDGGGRLYYPYGAYLVTAVRPQ